MLYIESEGYKALTKKLHDFQSLFPNKMCSLSSLQVITKLTIIYSMFVCPVECVVQ